MTLQAPLRSLKRNYFFSAVSALIGILYPIVTLAYVARIMGPGALGKYYFATSLAAYFLFAAGLGIPVYGTREIGRVRGNPEELKRIFSQLFFINGLSTVFFTVAYGIVVAVVPDFRAEAALFGILGLLVLNNIFSFEFLYAGLERQDQIAYRSLASKLVSMALIFILVRDPDDYLWFAAISVIMALANNALALKGFKYWAGFKEVARSTLRLHFRPILLIALSMLFINVYINLDSVILGLIADPHAVGLYNASVRPCRLVSVLLSSMLGASLPRLSYYFAGGGDHGVQHALKKKSLEMLMMLAIPVSLTFAVSAGPMVRIMYGAEFADAAPALVLAAPLLLLNCVATFHLYQIVVPMGKETLLVYIAATGAIVSVILNLVLIPVFGYQGAVVAALSAEMATLVVQFILIQRAGKNLLVFPTEAWKHLVAGGLLAATQAVGIPAARGSLFGISAVWAASAAVYGITLWILREPLIRQLTGRLAAFSRP